MTKELDQNLLTQGITYDSITDEYVSLEGHRISYNEWHGIGTKEIPLFTIRLGLLGRIQNILNRFRKS